jgi:site-specific DNA-methyltransferase (adenine-specific)
MKRSETGRLDAPIGAWEPDARALSMTKSRSILGDALEELRRMPSGTFDCCIADPPYNMSKKKGLSWAFSRHVTMQEAWDRFSKEEYFHFSFQWMTEMCRVVKPNGNLFVFGTYHNLYTQGFILQQLDRKVLNSIVWHKPNAQPNITCRMLTESSEQLVWACNNTQAEAKRWTFNYDVAKQLNSGKQMRNVWSIPLTSRKERVAGHPTQKPLQLLERLVLLSTRPGDWILDPFAGAGTTGIAAAKHGRNFVLIEKLPKYFEAQKARFAASGLKGAVIFSKAKPPKRKPSSPPPDATLRPAPEYGM